jgi:hypothetical protein
MQEFRVQKSSIDGVELFFPENQTQKRKREFANLIPGLGSLYRQKMLELYRALLCRPPLL